MKFKFGLFSNIILMLCCCCFISQQAFSKTCEAGKYYTVGGCKACPKNCYCPTNGDKTYSAFNVWCEGTETDSPKLSNWLGKQHGDRSSGWCDIWFCPKDYPYSAEGASSLEGCYARVAGKDVYNKSVKCDKGRYLPSQSNEDVACKDDGRSYCPGGTFHTSLSKDQGIFECSPDQKPNATKDACEGVSTEIECDPGLYLPKERKKCAPCPDNFSCPGGTYKLNYPLDQGNNTCDNGLKPNAKHTECIDASVVLKPGYYLPKGIGAKQKPCEGATYYCPGGDYVESAEEEQGRFQCPGKTTPNGSKTACSIKIDMDRMRVGPSLNTPEEFQCWTVSSDPKQYRSCILVNKYSQ